MKGSGWLTARRPGKRTTLGKFNRTHKMALYNLAVIEREDGLFLDLQGVRRRDAETLMEGILGVERQEWSVSYFRRLERYVALSQPEAEWLAAELGGEVTTERGRRTRLVWLHKHFTREVRIRTRARGVVHGKIYRVRPERGATAAYRLEVWLEGDKRRKTHFFEEDEAALDGVLGDLVREHGLHPIVRPHIWEGEGGIQPEFMPQDGELRRLTMSGYRGSQPWTWNRHPRSEGDSVARAVLRPFEGQKQGGPRISCPILPSHSQETPSTFSPGPSPSGERELASQIANDPISLLAEVVIDGQQEPTPLLRHLVDQLGGPGAVDVGYLGTPGDTWYGLQQLMAELPPVTGDEMSLVLLVEPDIIADLIEDTWSLPDGGIDHEALSRALYGTPAFEGSQTSCGLLADLLGQLRRLCETTGFKVVLVTVDDRPAHGRGPWRGSHRWSDARVRSAIGDAGRYWAHCRYRMELERTVLLKDERHGRPGSITWRRTAPSVDVGQLLSGDTGQDEQAEIDFELGFEAKAS